MSQLWRGPYYYVLLTFQHPAGRLIPLHRWGGHAERRGSLPKVRDTRAQPLALSSRWPTLPSGPPLRENLAKALIMKAGGPLRC